MSELIHGNGFRSNWTRGAYCRLASSESAFWIGLAGAAIAKPNCHDDLKTIPIRSSDLDSKRLRIAFRRMDSDESLFRLRENGP